MCLCGFIGWRGLDNISLAGRSRTRPGRVGVVALHLRSSTLDSGWDVPMKAARFWHCTRLYRSHMLDTVCG